MSDMNGNSNSAAPAIWGGIECTINRVGNLFFDQLEIGGFYNRQDINEIIKLGIKALRFPLLWEKHQPIKHGAIDWNWATGQLETLQANNIVPIVGLVHHGSGPSYTNLLQNDFPELLAAYAEKAATQFPWIEYYTPVNEPLTTARFSGLYGIWYPHKKNDVSFIKILLNELKGVVLSMQAIRKINPAAKLVQTEDLGKTYSTPLLSYQANFENIRRWLTYDILCGKVNKQHELWGYLMRLGIDEAALQFFLDNPCKPDIIGVNHYLTSERYLDEDIEQYPLETHGGNTLHQYADVEAIRVNIGQPHGLEVLLKEVWERYNIPLAITEVHLHCSREEQMRWFKKVVDTAKKLSAENVDIKAVTAWALLGSFGWNRLLTITPMEYETGAFDISAGQPRITALGELIKSTGRQEETKGFLLDSLGWWQRSSRFFKKSKEEMLHLKTQGKPLLILGKTGTLGKAFSKICAQRNIHYYALGRNELDVNDKCFDEAIKKYDPWAIINATGYVKVDEAEDDRLQCDRINAFAVRKLAIVCEQQNIKLMCFSSDLVFDGTKQSPYIETDEPNPLNVYGHSKLLAESFLKFLNPSALTIRTSAFFGPWDDYNFVSTTLSKLNNNIPVHVPDDIIVSPTYVPHLVQASLNLLIDDEKGIWHLANKGSLSWYQFAMAAAEYAGLDTSLIIPTTSMATIAKRPLFSALASEKYTLMPTLEQGLQEYFSNRSITVNH